MAAIVSHELKECKDQGPDNSFDKSAIIVVGSTGIGKTSLIGLFCGPDVVASDGAESGTKDPSLYQDLTNQQRHWLDTQGSNDSSGVEDEKILTDIMRSLHDGQVGSVKIVWCVPGGDITRSTKEINAQARFIRLLGENPWGSTLIIKKGGALIPSGMEIQGVLAAASHHGSNGSDCQLFGFTGLEYGHIENNQMYQVICALSSDDTQKQQTLQKQGFLTNKQIMAEVNVKVAQLSPLSLTFTIKECTKCGVKGDERFIFAPCHTELEKHHPRQPVLYHSGKKYWTHPSGTYSTHPGSFHAGSGWYHSGEWRLNTGRNVVEGIFTLGIGSIVRAANDSFHDWSCCGSTNKNSSGCKYSSSSYSCCDGGSGSSGCVSKYRCCDWSWGSSGCEERYDCCNQSASSNGCKQRYPCCYRDVSDSRPGCEQRCQSCHKEWGSTEGCTKTTKKQKQK